MKPHQRAWMNARAAIAARDPNSNYSRMLRWIKAYAAAQGTEAAEGQRAPATRSAYALAGRLLAEATHNSKPTH